MDGYKAEPSWSRCLKALQHAFELGQQSRELPVYTVGERRKTPRGDVARGVVDAAMASGDVQEID